MNNINQLLDLAKQMLGIASASTAKDDYIRTIIQAGIKDMERAGVDVETRFDELSTNTVLTYVKANFGISNPDDKAKYLESYQLSLANLCLSNDYKEDS